MTSTSADLRPAGAGDVEGCLEVFYEAGEELHARVGQPVLPRNPQPLGRLFGHLIETDPQRSWVAVDGGRVIAFGLAHRRGDTWFLAFLFVLPSHQGRGLGRALVERCLAGERPPIRSVCAEAIQPVSIGLYASLGMAPRATLYVLTGHLRERVLAAGVEWLEAVPFGTGAGLEASLQTAGIADTPILGYHHPQDHAFWVRMERRGYRFVERASGEEVGYGYVTDSGRLGPIAVTDERWLSPALGCLTATIEEPEAWLAFVPGTSAALVPLLRAGMRIDGPPAIFQSTARPPVFERYVVANFAVL